MIHHPIIPVVLQNIMLYKYMLDINNNNNNEK